MKVSKLIQRLVREIDDKTSSRDELLARALLLNNELKELNGDREIITKLNARYSGDKVVEQVGRQEAVGASDASGEHDRHDVQYDVSDHDGTSGRDSFSPLKDEEGEEDEEETPVGALETGFAEGLVGGWPVGPHYKKQFKAKTRQAWALYKLGTADWYLSTLREVVAHVDKIDRYLGIEMAIDGALQALCATFDAAVFALISTLETSANVPSDEKTPAHLASWWTLVDQAEALGVDLSSATAVFEALSAEDRDSPEGWLAQLLLLRDRSAQHDLLIRHWPLGSGSPVVCIDVPGDTPQPPLEYLTRVRDLVGNLLMEMLDDQELLRLARAWTKEPRKMPSTVELPDLLRRAGIPPRF